MPTAKVTLRMRAPVEKVFSYVGDPQRWPEFTSLYQKVEKRSGEGVDAIYHVSGDTGKRTLGFDIKITRLEPLKRISWRYVGSTRGSASIELRDEDGTTLVRVRDHFSLRIPLLFWLLEALYLNRHYTDTVRAGLEKLHSLVEPSVD